MIFIRQFFLFYRTFASRHFKLGGEIKLLDLLSLKAINSKYHIISKEIINWIESGDLQSDDKVPSENELINTYKIYNTTTRKSLAEVELQSWATRINGNGTFVLN
jgi:DNA-binding GntR family transcriptional regulator